MEALRTLDVLIICAAGSDALQVNVVGWWIQLLQCSVFTQQYQPLWSLGIVTTTVKYIGLVRSKEGGNIRRYMHLASRSNVPQLY